MEDLIDKGIIKTRDLDTISMVKEIDLTTKGTTEMIAATNSTEEIVITTEAITIEVIVKIVKIVLNNNHVLKTQIRTFDSFINTIHNSINM